MSGNKVEAEVRLTMVIIVPLVGECAVDEVRVVQGGGAGGFQQAQPAPHGTLFRAADRSPY